MLAFLDPPIRILGSEKCMDGKSYSVWTYLYFAATFRAWRVIFSTFNIGMGKFNIGMGKSPPTELAYLTRIYIMKLAVQCFGPFSFRGRYMRPCKFSRKPLYFLYHKCGAFAAHFHIKCIEPYTHAKQNRINMEIDRINMEMERKWHQNREFSVQGTCE